MAFAKRKSLGYYRLNKSHPIAKDLAFCFVLDGNWGWRNLVDNKRLTPGSTSKIAAGTLGMEHKSDGNDTSAAKAVDYAPILTSDGAGAGAFTVGVVGSFVSTATVGVVLSQRKDSGDNFRQWGLVVNEDSTGAASAGYASFVLIENSAIDVRRVAAASMSDGTPHVYVGRRLADIPTLWRDGVLAATGLSFAGDVVNTTQDFAIGGIAENTVAPLNSGSSIILAVGWNRALSNAEIAKWSADPYCILRLNKTKLLLDIISAGTTVTADKFTLTLTPKTTSNAYNVSIPATKFTQAITMKGTAQAISSAVSKFTLAITPKTTSNAYNVSIPAAKFSLAVTMKGTAQAISTAAAKFTLSINMKTLTFTGEVISLVARVAGFIGQNVGRLLGR